MLDFLILEKIRCSTSFCIFIAIHNISVITSVVLTLSSNMNEVYSNVMHGKNYTYNDYCFTLNDVWSEFDKESYFIECEEAWILSMIINLHNIVTFWANILLVWNHIWIDFWTRTKTFFIFRSMQTLIKPFLGRNILKNCLCINKLN